MIYETDVNLSFVPLDRATEPPPGYCHCTKNCWWIVHPTKGLIFYRRFSPQCNANKEIAERLRDKLYPWAEVLHIPYVFRPSDERES